LAATTAAAMQDRLRHLAYVNEELKSLCLLRIAGISELRLVHNGPSYMHCCCTFALH